MADANHLSILEQGVEAWNQWREANPQVRPNLYNADLYDKQLKGINFARANLVGAHLMRTDLTKADFHFCDLTCANLMAATLDGANLDGADLFCANFARASLRNAQVRRTNLMGAVLVETDLTQAQLTESLVYGVSAWNANLEGAAQYGLVVTGPDQPHVTVDHLEMAQFVAMVLHNENIRNALDTLTSKLVLILGRFAAERKAVLDALRDAMRERGYAPVIFDFEPTQQTLDETISTLGHMSRFVIADLTDAKSVLQELRAIVPNSPSVIVQPLLLQSQDEPGMFDFFRTFDSVMRPVRYADQQSLLATLNEKIIAPMEAKAAELAEKRKKLAEPY
jgi:uncharacterized protein YjbI with pentapeptide repeats